METVRLIREKLAANEKFFLFFRKDNILMPIRGEGLMNEDEDEEDGQPEREPQKVVYILHPNCAIEDM